jgi:hypothetical protein
MPFLGQMGETELLILNLKKEVAQLRSERQQCVCPARGTVGTLAGPDPTTDPAGAAVRGVGALSPPAPGGCSPMVSAEEHAATLRESSMEILRLCTALECAQGEAQMASGLVAVLREENEE